MIESENVPGEKRSNKHTDESQKQQQKSMRLWRNHDCVPSAQTYNLTICDAPKFIWFRNAKVGTRSTFTALEEANVKLTAESIFGCHYSPQEYRDYFKFSFVRNPWDRFVSGWINTVVRRNAFDLDAKNYAHVQTFDNFVSYCSELDLESWNSHFRHQCKLIDLNEIDFIGRLENFDRDIKEIFDKLDIPLPKVPNKNKSRERSHYSSYYTQKSKSLVGGMYRKDIQLFGYEFEEPRD